jgi:serine/threonine-protein kinase
MPEEVVEQRARARVGTTLNGKYRLDRLLGVGGMASVYAATHRNNKRLAVKVLHTELSIIPDLRLRFMREGYVANTVDHPGAVAVLDDDVTDDGAAFLVMELLLGATLAEASERRGGTIPLRAVLAAADQVLDVLAAADARHIVHRDIKPANLFLTTTGQVKVLDFGVARMRDAQGQHTTHSGMALGTPAFMAPEQALGRSEDISGRTDVWALGATMFALVTGRSVHQASSGQQQIVYAATRSAESLAAVDPTTPAEVAAIVDRALAFHPHARWESAGAMRDALRAAHRGLYGEEPSAASLAALALSIGAPGTGPDLPRSPMASTVPATPPDGAAGVRSARAPDQAGSGRTPPVSLAGTMSQPHVAFSARARVAIGGALLIGGGALIGAWAATRSHAPQGLPIAASTGFVSTGSGPVVTPSASAASALSAPSASAASAASASSAPSASSAALLGVSAVSSPARVVTPAGTIPVRAHSSESGEVHSKSTKTPAAAASSAAPDLFDHQ